MSEIAVLLTVHNRKEKTLECLRCLYNQLPIEGYEVNIFLTDDGCTDGTPEAISKEFPLVKMIKGDGSLFWNRGMYIAWEQASKTKKYNYFLWLNDDTLVYSNMLIKLLETSNDFENKCIIIGATQDQDNKRMTYGGRNKNGTMVLPNGKVNKVSYFNGNIVLIPNYVYNKLGNLDYFYKHSKGDFDYGMRAKEAGIGMFQAGDFLGTCELHPCLDKWCNPRIPITKRIRLLNKPNGMPPKETYYFEKKHLGKIHAAFHFFTIYIRCILPVLWIIRDRMDKKHRIR